MTLSTGDVIKYGKNGVCRVEGTAVRDFTGSAMKYYVLKPVHGQCSTVYIPAEREDLEEKIQRVLSFEEINDLIEKIPSFQGVWIEDERDRQEEYKRLLSAGSRKDLIGLIKVLYEKQQGLSAAGKKLHAADERIMKEAERLLYDEFSAALGIAPEEVVSFIVNRLEGETSEI